MSYLLTIGIPTYNRGKSLIRCLESIVSQLAGLEQEVELLVSDNASIDDTSEVVTIYNKQFPIRYIKNFENKGADYNIAQVFSEATGKYVWIFGDDDFLLSNALIEFLPLLRGNDVGNFYLNAISFTDEIQLKNKSVDRIIFEVYEEAIEYYKEINYYTTFITGNVINKSILDFATTPYFEKTNLIQLGWTIPAIFIGKKNIIIKSPIVAAEADNTGGYKLVTTFAKNYTYILNELVAQGYNKEIVSITKKSLLDSFFPRFIYKLLYEDNAFEAENSMLILFSHYWKYFLYWKNIFPIYVKFIIKKSLRLS